MLIQASRRRRRKMKQVSAAGWLCGAQDGGEKSTETKLVLCMQRFQGLLCGGGGEFLQHEGVQAGAGGPSEGEILPSSPLWWLWLQVDHQASPTPQHFFLFLRVRGERDWNSASSTKMAAGEMWWFPVAAEKSEPRWRRCDAACSSRHVAKQQSSTLQEYYDNNVIMLVK